MLLSCKTIGIWAFKDEFVRRLKILLLGKMDFQSVWYQMKLSLSLKENLYKDQKITIDF